MSEATARYTKHGTLRNNFLADLSVCCRGNDHIFVQLHYFVVAAGLRIMDVRFREDGDVLLCVKNSDATNNVT
jgi:hypothetical protein